MNLSPSMESAWSDWIFSTKERCHLNFELEGGTIATHISACTQSGVAAAERVRRDIGETAVKRILEVGSSVGFNCIGLVKVFPDAEVYGIEPDGAAVRVGAVMASEAGLRSLHFQCGVGERLPFEACFFDLVVCHTVIEHVNDVDMVIAEIARVLSSKGVLHLEAPNYVWPYEPHLSIWCIPLLGKRLMRLLARVQNKSHQIAYLKHLQFVHPNWLERLFRQFGLTWENRVEQKINAILSGDLSVARSYRASAILLTILGRIGISSFAKAFILRARLYPSILYTVRKSRLQ